MPGGDRTGSMGQGPRTGRGMRFGRGMGGGRGFGRGRGLGYPYRQPMSKEDEINLLKSQADALNRSQKANEKRLEELEKE